MTRIRTILIPIVSVIVIYASVVVGYNIPRTTHSDPPKPTVAQGPDIETLWSDTNQQRTNDGKRPLVLDPFLTSSAMAKCADMIQHKYWGHNSPTGKTPQDFITAYAPGWTHSGENLSLGYDTSDKVTTAWMNSTGHRANILNEYYTRVGYAVCTNTKSQIMVVQHFAN